MHISGGWLKYKNELIKSSICWITLLGMERLSQIIFRHIFWRFQSSRQILINFFSALSYFHCPWKNRGKVNDFCKTHFFPLKILTSTVLTWLDRHSFKDCSWCLVCFCKCGQNIACWYFFQKLITLFKLFNCKKFSWKNCRKNLHNFDRNWWEGWLGEQI